MVNIISIIVEKFKKFRNVSMTLRDQVDLFDIRLGVNFLGLGSP